MARPEGPDPAITVPAQYVGGVWANHVRAVRGRYEFTVDFVRVDHFAPAPGTGVVVARVGVSAPFMAELLDVLREEWSDYVRRAMPPETYDERGDDGA